MGTQTEMPGKIIRIVERDEAGNVLATYVQSPGSKDALSRIDIIQPEVHKSAWQRLLDVFLPAGYPHSVTDDYLEYQIYDSLQAFSSSIASLLSSRAVLSSVGVGDSTASPTAALLLSVLQESAGRIATILFAHRFGTSLEPECKMYRLLADILNDLAFVLDCLSPIFPKPIRVVILSFSSVLRALCGVAAGSAKASLSAHFARWGNLGELNAKDSSQETVISLMGMLVGSVVVSWVTTPFATWTLLILLLSVHLETNRRAVRAVSMRTLNRQRATLLYHRIKHGNGVPTPKDISAEEWIFERGGVLRRYGGGVSGYCALGVSVFQLFRGIRNRTTGSFKATKEASEEFQRRLDLYHERKYILLCEGSVFSGVRVQVVLKAGATSEDILMAWWQALIVSDPLDHPKERSVEIPLDKDIKFLEMTMSRSMQLLNRHREALVAAGWDLKTNALETTSSTRISIEA